MKDDLTDKTAESYQNNGMPIALKVSLSSQPLWRPMYKRLERS
jgi:hypothetical protein